MTTTEFIEARKRLQLSQAKFALAIGKSLRQVQYYEAGKQVIPAHVEKLIHFLLKQKPKK